VIPEASYESGEMSTEDHQSVPFPLSHDMRISAGIAASRQTERRSYSRPALPHGSIPRAGKTTHGLQFLLERPARGVRGLFIHPLGNQRRSSGLSWMVARRHRLDREPPGGRMTSYAFRADKEVTQRSPAPNYNLSALG
jgi:hypothetical protein